MRYLAHSFMIVFALMTLGGVLAVELKGVGLPLKRPEDIVVCHACAAVASEFCDEAMKHQLYLEEKFGIERKRAADLDKEVAAGLRAPDDTDMHLPAIGTKYPTTETVLRDLAYGACEDFRLMKYDHIRRSLQEGDRHMTRTCEQFVREHSELLVEFFQRFYLLEISCVRGVDIFCNDYVDACSTFDITLVKMQSGTNAAVYVAGNAQQEQLRAGQEALKTVDHSHDNFIENDTAIAAEEEFRRAQRELEALRDRLEREELGRALGEGHDGGADHQDAASASTTPPDEPTAQSSVYVVMPDELERAMMAEAPVVDEPPEEPPLPPSHLHASSPATDSDASEEDDGEF